MKFILQLDNVRYETNKKFYLNMLAVSKKIVLKLSQLLPIVMRGTELFTKHSLNVM
jgi:hypothetical protein